MNLEFVRMLQSMAEVEKDPHFRSKKYVVVDKEDCQVDPASGAIPVVLKHPYNVIVVASPTGNAPPPAIGELRVDQLSTALDLARISAKRGSRGCSIVINEGMYIDFTPVEKEDFGAFGDFSLEIVGTEEVRIVATSPIDRLFYVPRGCSLALKNLAIYGCPRAATSSSDAAEFRIYATASKLFLVDVRIHGSNCGPLCDEGSEMLAIDCVFSESKSWFGVVDAKAEYRNCRWIEEFGAHTQPFIPYGFVVGEGEATFRQCQFVMKNGCNEENYSAAIGVSKGGKIVMTETLVSGFYRAISVIGSYSRAELDNCKILDCSIAIFSRMNSIATVSDCEIVTDAVLQIQLNEEGQVKFRRNSLKLFARAPKLIAKIYADREPKVVDHDFKVLQIRSDCKQAEN